MTAVCCVTDCSAFGGSFFAASGAGAGFSAGFSWARADAASEQTRSEAQKIRFMTFPLDVRREAYRAEAGRDSIGAR